MKSLRYIALLVVAMFVAVEASAWTGEVNRAILMFAEENLSNKTKKRVEMILDKPLHEVTFANKGKNKTRLNEQWKSVTTDESDAVVRLEKALSVLNNENASMAECKAALIDVVELTVDIHCPSNILIDKHLEKNFSFGGHNSMQIGFRYYAVKKFDWQSLWHKVYHTRHGVFSSDMYLYDWEIATKGMAKGYRKEPVAPRKWVEQVGERISLSLKTLQPDAVVETVELAKLEPLNDMCLYDAGFHLANLLNKTLK